jgi:hypothetical protein
LTVSGSTAATVLVVVVLAVPLDVVVFVDSATGIGGVDGAVAAAVIGDVTATLAVVVVGVDK